MNKNPVTEKRSQPASTFAQHQSKPTSLPQQAQTQVSQQSGKAKKSGA